MNINLYPIINLKKDEILDVKFLTKILNKYPEYIQLRIKDGSENDFVKNSMIILNLIKEKKVKLFINDHPEIAKKVKAHGVHVGQDDFEVHSILNDYPDLKVGLSTHNIEQVKDANKINLEYIGFGPVFETDTKQTPYSPRISIVNEVMKVSNHKVVFIGGINKSNINFLPITQNTYIALISAIHEFI